MQHDRLNVERRISSTEAGRPIGEIKTSDVARLMELFQVFFYRFYSCAAAYQLNRAHCYGTGHSNLRRPPHPRARKVQKRYRPIAPMYKPLLHRNGAGYGAGAIRQWWRRDMRITAQRTRRRQISRMRRTRSRTTGIQSRKCQYFSLTKRTNCK